MNGFDRTYEPLQEGGDVQPPERQHVQYKYLDVFTLFSQDLRDLFDVTAVKDYTNCDATADVVVDGKTLLANAPVTFLLFLEKELQNLQTFLQEMPELDIAEDWKFDERNNVFRTEQTLRQSTKKLQRPLVLVQPTEHHPAQCQIITEDVVVGTWRIVKLSGAMPLNEKRAFLKRVETLMTAVKFAREEPHTMDARTVSASPLVDYLFQR
jgi:hypothetical protein